MDLKTAKKILNDMLELCSQMEDQILSDAVEGIYRDVEAAKSLQTVITSGRELMVFIGEVPDDEFNSDIKAELEELYISLLDDEL